MAMNYHPLFIKGLVSSAEGTKYIDFWYLYQNGHKKNNMDKPFYRKVIPIFPESINIGNVGSDIITTQFKI